MSWGTRVLVLCTFNVHFNCYKPFVQTLAVCPGCHSGRHQDSFSSWVPYSVPAAASVAALPAKTKQKTLNTNMVFFILI